MSSQLINFTSDLHGSSENILRADDIRNNTFNLIIRYKSTNETTHSFPHCKSSKTEFEYESRSNFYNDFV